MTNPGHSSGRPPHGVWPSVVVRPFVRIVATLTLVVGPFATIICTGAEAGADVEFDLTDEHEASRWTGRHDVGNVATTPDGLRIEITGADPYMHSESRDFPADTPLLLEIRLKSEAGGTAQMFYFRRGPSESQSVRFAVPAGQSYDAVVPLPALGPAYRLRFDPPGTRGICTIERLRVVPRPRIAPPPAPQAEDFSPRDEDWRLTSGEAELRHARNRWSKFELSWRGKRVAISHARPWLGLLRSQETRWINLSEQALVESEWRDGRLAVRATMTAADLPKMRLEQLIEAGAMGAFEVSTTIDVDGPCDLVHLPTLVLLPGFGSHGERKSQGLFAGVEYLADEPSRSTADLEGAAANRLVPAPHKVTFPLMAIQHDDHFVSLMWTPVEQSAAIFDSPDRTFGGGAHALGLLAPGAEAPHRADGEFVAYRPVRLTPARPLRQTATIVAGRGGDVTAAVQDYVRRRGLPDVPPTPPLEAYVRLAAAGWLDSPLRDGDRYRHAVGNSFPAQPAMDVAWMLRWLGDATPDTAMRDKLTAASRGAAAAVAAGHEFHAHVGHLKHPVAGLTVTPFEVTAAQARDVARGQHSAFGSDGIARYQPPRAGIDYSRTQPSREASGFAALPVAVMLEAAAYAGDDALVAIALDRLAKLDRYDGDVPRGAQTWEIALHTPDILASAHMVRAYSLAFRLTGNPRWLARARYWAWTGVPFVYLRRPANGEVGPYATTAVLGATQWQQPVWIGLPVQWCGLVYADSLRWLEPHDPSGPWRQLADGITASGIEQTYPLGHVHQGLLPDSFDLPAQQRNPADINPGTLQPLALRLLTGRPSHALLTWPARKLRVYAAGQLEPTSEAEASVSFRATPWSAGRSQIVVHGLPRSPRVTLDGQALDVKTIDGKALEGKTIDDRAADLTTREAAGDCRYLSDFGTLVLRVSGREPKQVVIDGLAPPGPASPAK